MPVKATFGQRNSVSSTKSSGSVSAPRQSTPSVASAFSDPGTVGIDALPYVRRAAQHNAPPFVTGGLIILLSLVFWMEISQAVDLASLLSPSRQDLIALGGVDGKLVFGAQEWWRAFTAPLLHGSLTHLLGNSIALFFAGIYLEPVIGAGWFTALFAIAALGGVAGSLALNDPDTVSVGASGAIMGLLIATLLCSSEILDTKRRLRMQLVAGRILVPSLLPAFSHPRR